MVLAFSDATMADPLLAGITSLDILFKFKDRIERIRKKSSLTQQMLNDITDLQLVLNSISQHEDSLPSVDQQITALVEDIKTSLNDLTAALTAHPNSRFIRMTKRLRLSDVCEHQSSLRILTARLNRMLSLHFR
jgi:hypothetical protein